MRWLAKDHFLTFLRVVSGTSLRRSYLRQQGKIWSAHSRSQKLKILLGRVIIELNEVTTRELQPAVTVLQLFLSSSKPILRFAAIRALNKVAMNNPSSMTNCNIDMESMISDQNRSIATLAITTLLKTGKESSIDRLMKQISTFMSDIQVKYHKHQNEGVIFRTFLL